MNGSVVTDRAVGEAAICRFRGLLRELVSIAPSDWLFTPVNVIWVRDDASRLNVSVPNHWTIASVQASLAANPERTNSWAALETQTRRTCTRLTFAEYAFRPLDGHPYVPGAAERIRVLLHVLNELKGCFDEKGQRSSEGHRLYEEHFKGEKAWFSDSSETEKNDFHKKLTFPHPDAPGESLFCSWHGKVKTPQIRIHFSWPVRSDTTLYVVYVGPKITVR